MLQKRTDRGRARSWKRLPTGWAGAGTITGTGAALTKFYRKDQAGVMLEARLNDRQALA